MSIARFVRQYLSRGWQVVPIPPRQKRPVVKDWTRRTFGLEDFPEPSNVGVKLGEPSGWLVDIDLDAPETLPIAELFLPVTAAVFGHPSKPRSHRLYIAEGAKTERFEDPDGTVLVEVRSTGGQTVFPPSVHPSGEVIAWEDPDGEPARVAYPVLRRAVAKLAAATLLARYWPTKGSRQEAALALSGGLLRLGWPEDEIQAFIRAVCEAAGDEETRNRIATAGYTVRKDGPKTGWRRLGKLVGEKMVDRVREWLGAREADRFEPAAAKLWTASEIAAADFPEPRWLVPGLLSEGGLVLLAGRPKIGKSWLALDLACGLAAGAEVCGVPVAEAVPTLYLALEDSPRRIKARLTTANLPVVDECRFMFAAPKLPDFLDFLRGIVAETGVRVVVLDVLARVRPGRRRDADLYAEDYAVLSSLKAVADELGITLVVIHHLRKTEADDPLLEISGSTGIAGAADAVLVLKRARGQADGTLDVIARDTEDVKVALRFESGRWTVIGDAAEYALSQERRRLLEAIQETGGAKPKEIAEITGLPYGSVKHLLRKLEAEGLVYSVDGEYLPKTGLTVHFIHSIHSVHPVHRVHPVNGERSVNAPIHPAEPYSDRGLRPPVNTVNAVNATPVNREVDATFNLEEWVDFE